MKKFLLLSTILLCMGGLWAQSWQPLQGANACSMRHENSLTAVGDRLVLVGGRGIKPLESFDLRTKQWTRHPDTPLEISHFQAVAYRDELWVLGAFTGSYPHELPIGDIYIFNFEKNAWRKGPAIPANRLRGAAGVVVYNNKIYLVCGEQDGHWDGTVAWLDEYDPATDTWKILPDAPHIRDHVTVAVTGDKLYVAGGRRSTARIGQVLNLTEPAVDVYDFKTGKWLTLPATLNLPTQRAGAAAVALGDKILIIGGESPAHVEAHREVEAFNTATQQWEKLPLLLQGRHGTGAVNVNGKIYIVAGSANRGGGPELDTIEVF